MFPQLRALVLLVALAGGACNPAFRDGEQVEGRWVTVTSRPATECGLAVASRCPDLVAVATDRLIAREPGARIRDVRFHDVPHEMWDGTLVATTLPAVFVVFTLEDGSRRLESFQCDGHGRVTAGSDPVYEPYCPD